MILMICRLPKYVQREVSEIVRPESLDEFSVHFERFATSRNRTVGSYFSELKYKPTFNNIVQINQPKNHIQKPTSEDNGSKKLNSCNFCAKPGHSEEKCFSKNPEKRPKTTSQENESKSNSKIRHIVIRDTYKTSRESGTARRSLTANLPVSTAPSSAGLQACKSSIRRPSIIGTTMKDHIAGSSASVAPFAEKCRDTAFKSAISGAAYGDSTVVSFSPADPPSGVRHKSSAILGAPYSADKLQSVAPRAFISAAKRCRTAAVSCAPVSAEKRSSVAQRAPNPASKRSSAADRATLRTYVPSILQLILLTVLEAIICIIQQPLRFQLLQLIILPLLQGLSLMVFQYFDILRPDIIIILPVFLLWMILFISKFLIPHMVKNKRAWASCKFNGKATFYKKNPPRRK